MSHTLAALTATTAHLLKARLAEVRAAAKKAPDEGLVLIEWILLIGVVAAAVLVIAAIVVVKITAKANGLNL